MKKIKKFTLMFFTALLICFGVACKEGEVSTGNNDSSPSTESTLQIAYTKREIKLMESFYLEPTFGGTALEGVQYLSSNPLVASVRADGKVSGIGIGSAEITVSFGEYSAKCEITVGMGAELPSLQFYQVEHPITTISEIDLLDLSCYVQYDNTKYTDAIVSYSLDNPDAGVIVNGKFLPNELVDNTAIETTITVSAAWKNVETNVLNKEIIVKVIPVEEEYTYLTVNGLAFSNGITLYTTESFEGKTYDIQSAFVCKVVKNGEEISDPENIKYNVGDESIAKIEGDIVKGISAGQTEINVEYFDDETVIASLNVVIDVIRPVTPHETTLNMISAVDGVAVPEEIMPSNLIVKATQNAGEDKEKELTIRDGKAFGVETSAKEKTFTKITFYTQTYGYEFNVNGYTKILKTQDDLYDLSLNEGNGYELSGYYYLNNDITVDTDWEGVWQPGASNVLSKTAQGFKGIFDGNGKILTLTKVTESGRNGLFGRVGEKALIKNLGITVTEVLGGTVNSNIIAFYIAENATLENMSICYTPSEKTSNRINLLSYQTCYNAVLRDIYIYVSENVQTTDVEHTYGYLGGYFLRLDKANATQYLENVRVVSKNVIYAKYDYDYVKYYASNDDVVEDDKTFKKTGVYRYDNVAALQEAMQAETETTMVGNWTINADGSASYTQA
jgi:hypothetical protein